MQLIEGLPKWKRLLCLGGATSELSKSGEKNVSENQQMKFFRETYSTFLLKRSSRFGVLLLYILYLGGSLYGILTLDENQYTQRIYRQDSYIYKFLVIEEDNLPRYYMSIQVMIASPLDYSDPTIQSDISNLLSNMTSSPHVTPEFSQNWLNSFLSWAKIYGEFEDIDISTKQGFIDTLRNHYLANSSRTISTDIVFNSDYTDIIATRYILATINITSRVEQLKQTVVHCRAVGDSYKSKFDVYVSTYWNRFIDEGLMIRPLAINLVSFASFLVLVIVIVFIPSITVACSVFFAIVSTQWGVIGFMSLWGISLDSISTISLIMCIGFSVDFATHFSYAWASADCEDIEGKLRSSLHAVGLPIVQGALSSIIGSIPLATIPAYMFWTLVRLMILVMVFSALHALLILPVILMFVTKYKFWGVKPNVYYVTKL